MAEYNSDRTGANIDATLDKVDVRETVIDVGSNTTNRAKVDGSGNFMVGKPSIGIASVGCEFRASGQITGTSDSIAGVFNRIGTNGMINRFYKDSLPVGSIDSVSSSNLAVKGTGGIVYLGGDQSGGLLALNSTATGQPRLQPRDDATTNLGGTTSRFKDLYLSGGVYLGGTGAANKLDDYETGTWTPTLSTTATAPTVTHGVQTGHYVKVGKQVTITWRMSYTALSGGTGSAIIVGLPFTVQSVSNSHVQICSKSNITNIAVDNGGFIEPATTFMYLCNDALTVQAITSISGNGFVYGHAVYYTNS